LRFSALGSTVQAKAEKTPEHVEFDAETYSERGQTTGCGISLVTLWLSDSKDVVGVTGSVNFFFLSQRKNVAAALKVTGVINGKKVMVSFAWLDVKGYCKTAGFTGDQGEVPGSFIAWRHSDVGAAILPTQMSAYGFVLGLSVQGLPLDEIVELPPASETVTKKIVQCMDEIQARIQRELRGP
jgi:hypothetical protein